MHVTRAEIAAAVRRWQAGALDGVGLLAWVRERWPDTPARPLTVDDARDGLSVTREALAELDLLEVHLLVPDDAPALLALLDAPLGEEARALADWLAHRRGIDLAARSKRLKRDPLYRPFCK